jgi:hypothetical protein
MSHQPKLMAMTHCTVSHMGASCGLDVALVELGGNRVILQTFRLTEIPARDPAIAMAQTETARIAGPARPARQERKSVVYSEA